MSEPLCDLMAQFLHYREQTRWVLQMIHRELATLAVEEAPAAPRRDHAAAAGAGAPRGGGGDRW